MRCEKCQGTGKIYGTATYSLNQTQYICSDCQGSGIAHCCDGLTEQPSELRHTGISVKICDEAMLDAWDAKRPEKQWPLKGSDGLYDPINIHRGKHD